MPTRYPFFMCTALAWCLTVSLFAQSENGSRLALPSWLAGHGELLPNVSQEVIKRVENSWPKMQLPDTAIYKPPQEYWDSLGAFVELGEQGVLALVWIYAQEPPRLAPYSAISKSSLIRTVFLGDTTSESWVLPLLRHRLQWVENLLALDDQNQISKLGDELGAIQGYLSIRGDEQDYRNVMNLINKLAKANDVIRQELSGLVTAKYDAAADESRRKARRQQLFPYHEWAKLALTSRKDTAGNKQEAEVATTKGGATPKPSPTLKVPGEKPSLPDEKPASSTPWSIIVVLIVAALGLLWLLLKGRK